VRLLPLSPQRVAQKTNYSIFRKIKFNFSRIMCATKLLCVKTSRGKVVEQSVSYEIAKRYRTESVSCELKYWLTLIYPVVASICILARHTLSALPNDVMYKIECRQLHNELFGGRHSTLQSRGLFALSKLFSQYRPISVMRPSEVLDCEGISVNVIRLRCPGFMPRLILKWDLTCNLEKFRKRVARFSTNF